MIVLQMEDAMSNLTIWPRGSIVVACRSCAREYDITYRDDPDHHGPRTVAFCPFCGSIDIKRKSTEYVEEANK